MAWHKYAKCPKCDGQGWLWAHELNEYYGGSGDQSPMTDDTKYQCDHICHRDLDQTEMAH
jgi:hypothetical protein